jgi:Transcriptional regulatory protein, C terminal
MFETPFERDWKILRNPFQGQPETGEMITSRVSGRKADIQEIISEGQSAIILAGAPHIGKTSLIRYLLRPAIAKWSWRNELEDLRSYLELDEVSFTQIDLSQLEGATDTDDLLMPFITQCIAALQSTWPCVTATFSGLKGLRELLRHMTREYPDARYFAILDSIERLQGPGMPSLKEPTRAKTPQEHGLALLDDCGAFRVLVDLLDEFSQFGVILSIESLPLPQISNQFTHVSADLARFRTMTLQAFTQEDTLRFLTQDAESFGEEWAPRFRGAGGDTLFSQDTQKWLYEQAGTHPYLLQQFCFHTFHFKREYALRRGSWSDPQKTEREQLIERVNERISTFLDRTWKRVRASLDASSQETREKFYDFIVKSRGKSAREEIDPAIWHQLGLELRYILYSEGIVRSDPLQPIYYPGSVLLNYLAQKAQEQDKPTTSAILPQSQAMMSSVNELIITLPGKQPQPLELSSLEYALMKTFLHYPGKCSEEALMRSGWGKITSKQVLTQRIFHLRKKLKDLCDGEDMIENIYGGFYSLNHPEWFSLR